MTAPVSVHNATKTFGAFTALNDVSLDIKAGEFIVLLGPSGCGKTTLFFPFSAAERRRCHVGLNRNPAW